MLEDGRYDALVVDANDLDHEVIELDVTVLAGPHKGEMLTLRATGLDRDSIDLLAVPATRLVADGHPRVQLEG